MPAQKKYEGINDLLSVPADQIGACLAVFQDWLFRSKRLLAQAEADGIDTSKLELKPFAW